MKKTAAVVILYNPDDSVLKNVFSFSSYVDKVYLWQNSVVDNEFISVMERKLSDKLCWCGDKTNRGIGYALNHVLEECKLSNIDWLLTMDQDSQFSSTGIKKLKNYISNIPQCSSIALVSANHTINNKSEYKHGDSYRWVMMSGNFIDVTSSICVGGFDDTLFIDGVDIDFCLRLRAHAYNIEICQDARLDHKLGDTKDVCIFGYKTKTSNHGPLRLYYIFRNYPKILMRSTCDVQTRKILLKFLMHKLVCILLVESNKVAKIKMIGKGLFDFCLNRSGATF